MTFLRSLSALPFQIGPKTIGISSQPLLESSDSSGWTQSPASSAASTRYWIFSTLVFILTERHRSDGFTLNEKTDPPFLPEELARQANEQATPRPPQGVPIRSIPTYRPPPMVPLPSDPVPEHLRLQPPHPPPPQPTPPHEPPAATGACPSCGGSIVLDPIFWRVPSSTPPPPHVLRVGNASDVTPLPCLTSSWLHQFNTCSKCCFRPVPTRRCG
jgi:hypothetical protein